jgi:chromosome segregation ATPase
LRIAADLLVQKYSTTITSNEAQLKALLHDHEARQRQADSQIQDLIAERAKQGKVKHDVQSQITPLIDQSLLVEHCNGSLTAQVTLLTESESRQREEILKLRSELSKATAQINTVEVRFTNPIVGRFIHILTTLLCRVALTS